MSELKATKSKKLRSLVNDVPNKAEFQPVHLKTDSVLGVDDLQKQIDEARKGKAKVDSQYVGFELDERGHLFNYKFEYTDFLGDISHCIAEGKRRRKEKADNLYKEEIHMFNSPTSEKRKFEE